MGGEADNSSLKTERPEIRDRKTTENGGDTWTMVTHKKTRYKSTMESKSRASNTGNDKMVQRQTKPNETTPPEQNDPATKSSETHEDGSVMRDD